ncbi:MAG: hypothetical protein SGCHY_003335, partial [Lobulomycetales sp.]
IFLEFEAETGGIYARFVHLCTVTFNLLPEKMIFKTTSASNSSESRRPVRNTRSMIFVAEGEGSTSMTGELEDDDDDDDEDDDAGNDNRTPQAVVKVDELE